MRLRCLSIKLTNLVTLFVITASTIASPTSELPVLTADNRLDVGNAQILAGKLEQVCSTRFNNPAQAFQCKSACGGLYGAVQGVSVHLNRNAAPRIIKNSLRELVQRTSQCNQVWRRNFPAEFKPFALLLKSLHEGRIPQPGKPTPIATDSPAQYAQTLQRLAPQLASLGNVCHESLFKDSCLKSCDLSPAAQHFATLLNQGSLASLNDLNNMTPWVEQLKSESFALHRQSQQCAGHYGRTPASALEAVKTISKSVQDRSNEVFARHLAAEKFRREELARQQAAERQQKEAEKQHHYQQEIVRLRQCRNDSPFQGYSGCSYLTAVYDGEFKRAMEIEYQSSAPYRLGWMGEASKEMAKMFGSLYGSEEKFNNDMAKSWKAYHFIGRLLGTYATYYEHYYPQCIGGDPVVVTLTTERQKEYRNGYGHLVRTEHMAPETDTIYIPRRLYPYVKFNEINKDTQAQTQIWDMVGGAINKFPRINLFEVTMGLSDAMNNYACDSKTMQHLEQQMLAYQAHRQQYNRQYGSKLIGF